MVSSAIGLVSIDGLNEAVKFLINLVVLPRINGTNVQYLPHLHQLFLDYANKGLVIPTADGFSLINPEIEFGEVSHTSI